jgi:hypothetical protein
VNDASLPIRNTIVEEAPRLADRNSHVDCGSGHYRNRDFRRPVAARSRVTTGSVPWATVSFPPSNRCSQRSDRAGPTVA